MRLAGLVMGAAALVLCAEAYACNPKLNFPDSCNAYDQSGNYIDGPGRSTRTETPTTATDATVKGPHNDSTLQPTSTPQTLPLLDHRNSIQSISQPPPTTAPATTSPPYQRYPPGFTGVTGFSGNPSLPAMTSRPGGISLSRAAAERMPLNLSIDSAYIKDGRIVLSGQPASHGSIDAAVFLTALRTTCEGHDPYFSLDPDDISEWQQATERGGAELFTRIKSDIGWSIRKGAKRNSPSILHFRTLSASRDYPELWKKILTKYPALRSRLVFGPDWLRETRFGEILYKADVLLKELAGGTPSPNVPNLRASRIPGYISATQQTAAKRLLYKHHNIQESKFALTGGRIWYDLSESSSVPGGPPEAITNVKSELNTLLLNRGLLRRAGEETPKPVSLLKSDGALDISDVYPRMYVRVRDPVSGRDASGNFPGIDELVLHANKTPQHYAAAYQEYRALVEVFRAYVAAVYATRRDSGICRMLPKGLLPEEKTAAPLPKYHPTELSLTVGWYEYSDGRFRRAESATGSLFNGGVSVGASAVLRQIPESDFISPILREIKTEMDRPLADITWKGQSGRHFIAFHLDNAEATKPVTRIALAKGEDFGPPVLPFTPSVVTRPSPAPTRVNPEVSPPSPPVAVKTVKVAQGSPEAAKPASISASSHGQRDLLVVAAVLTAALVALLLRLSLAGEKTAFQQANIIAMPDRSAPDSVPYVQPRIRDSLWSKRRSATPDSASPLEQDSAAKDAGYESIERVFKNVFAMKSMADRETMIRKWRNVHGGTRADAMTRLVEQWRHDNRA